MQRGPKRFASCPNQRRRQTSLTAACGNSSRDLQRLQVAPRRSGSNRALIGGTAVAILGDQDQEVLSMLTKMKIAIVFVGSLVAGVAGAQGFSHSGPDRATVIQKYDTNKDGKLDDQEKATMKADFTA